MNLLIPAAVVTLVAVVQAAPSLQLPELDIQSVLQRIRSKSPPPAQSPLLQDFLHPHWNGARLELRLPPSPSCWRRRSGLPSDFSARLTDDGITCEMLHRAGRILPKFDPCPPGSALTGRWCVGEIRSEKTPRCPGHFLPTEDGSCSLALWHPLQHAICPQGYRKRRLPSTDPSRFICKRREEVEPEFLSTYEDRRVGAVASGSRGCPHCFGDLACPEGFRFYRNRQTCRRTVQVVPAPEKCKEGWTFRQDINGGVCYKFERRIATWRCPSPSPENFEGPANFRTPRFKNHPRRLWQTSDEQSHPSWPDPGESLVPLEKRMHMLSTTPSFAVPGDGNFDSTPCIARRALATNPRCPQGYKLKGNALHSWCYRTKKFPARFHCKFLEGFTLDARPTSEFPRGACIATVEPGWIPGPSGLSMNAKRDTLRLAATRPKALDLMKAQTFERNTNGTSMRSAGRDHAKPAVISRFDMKSDSGGSGSWFNPFHTRPLNTLH